jgi:hypothetical protein
MSSEWACLPNAQVYSATRTSSSTVSFYFCAGLTEAQLQWVKLLAYDPRILHSPDRLWGPSSPLFNGYQSSPPPEEERPRREAEHSCPHSALNNEWNYTAAPPIGRRCAYPGTTLPCSQNTSRIHTLARGTYIHIKFHRPRPTASLICLRDTESKENFARHSRSNFTI